MLELYINDEPIDLSVDQELAMTYQVNDIGNIQFQKANFSNQFKIPKTKENCRKLGFIDQVTSADMRPYRPLSARIIQDGEEIVRNGVCTILSADDNINVVIYSGIKDFFATIGEDLLSDLDWSDLNHTWDLETIKTLMSSDSGICYPLVNYGALSPRGRSVIANYQFFGVYVKTIFERIFAAAGFEYYGSFLDHPAFDKLILPFTNGKYLSPGDVSKSSFVASGQTNTYGRYEAAYQIVGQPTGYPPSNVCCPGIDLSFTPGLYDITGNENGLFDGSYFTVGASPVRGTFRINGTVNIATADRYSIKIVSNLKGVLWRYTEPFLVENVKNFSGEIAKCDYLPGETLHIEIETQITNATWNIEFEFIADEEAVFGSVVDVARNLPKIKQKDFLKGVAHMFGMIYEQDENIRRVRMRQFDEIQVNKGASIDWSDKLHVPVYRNDRRRPQIFFDIGYAQVNHFRYKEDENVTEGFGDGVINVDNRNLPPEKTIIELPFAATESERQLSGMNISQVVQFQKKEGDALITGVEEYDPLIGYSKGQYSTYYGALYQYINDNPEAGKTPKFDGGDSIIDEQSMQDNTILYWQRTTIDALLQYEREFDTEPRILVAEKIGLQGDNLTLINELNGTTETIDGEIIIPYFIKPGGQFNLGFNNSLLEQNYKTVADITFKTKFVKAYFNLSGNDVKNIDYLIPRYVDYFGGFFYINRIEKFQHGYLTLVHLVRV